MSYKVKMLTPACLEVTMKYQKDFEQWFFLSSDAHFDNPYCDRKLWFRHLDEAVKKNAGILHFGDFFCAMGGKYDPRRSKSGIREEYNKSNYIDLIINDAADKHAKYAKNFVLFSDGNHETSILKNLETDLLQRLISLMNKENKAEIKKGKYQGFVKFKFQHRSGGKVRNKILFFHHGKWGGVVTKGVLGVDRYAAMVPDADIVVSGHTHDQWQVDKPRYRLKQNGAVKVEPQLHLKTGTYKEEFEKSEGWAVERIATPKNKGSWFIRFYIEDDDIKVQTIKVT